MLTRIEISTCFYGERQTDICIEVHLTLLFPTFPLEKNCAFWFIEEKFSAKLFSLIKYRWYVFRHPQTIWENPAFKSKCSGGTKLLNLWICFRNQFKSRWGDVVLFLEAVVMTVKLTASLLVLAHCLIVLECGDITCISEKTEVLSLPSPLLETYLQLLFFLPLSSSTCLVPGAGTCHRNNLTCSMLAHCKRWVLAPAWWPGRAPAGWLPQCASNASHPPCPSY